MRAAELKAEDGVGLIEVMASAIVLVVGLLTMVGSLDSSRDLVTTAERKEAAAHVAEREIEAIRKLPYRLVALDAAPLPSSAPNDPRYYVSAGPPATYRWN